MSSSHLVLIFLLMPFGYHTVLLTDQGLFAFGGKPSHSSEKKMPAKSPEVLWEGPKPVKVDWGRVHSLLLDEKGGVWEAGTPNQWNHSFTSSFRQVPGLPIAVEIAAGYNFSAVIDINGGVWVWWEDQSAKQIDISPLIKDRKSVV